MQRKPLILISLLLAAFVINLDTTIVNVALPTLVRELHASNSQLQWVVDAFNLLFAGSVLAAGQPVRPLRAQGHAARGPGGVRSGEPGRRPDRAAPEQLIAARAVMGLGAAMVFPSTLSLLTNVFTERRERALAIGLWGAITGVAIALGPIVGGWLLQFFDWRSIFFAMTPVAAIAGVLVAGNVPTSRDPRAPRGSTAPASRFRPRRSACSSTRSSRRRTTAGGAHARSAGFALTAVLAAAFVAWERRTEQPMLDLSPVPQPAVHRRERVGRDLVLRAVRVHLPGHPVLPVPQGLRPAVDRRAPAAGRHASWRSRRSSARSSRSASARSWSSRPDCS